MFGPGGRTDRHTFGKAFRLNEGQLLKLEEGLNPTTGIALKTTEHRYRSAGAQDAFPEQFGISPLWNSDHLSSRNRPQDRRVVQLDGATFTWEAAAGAAGLDTSARPRQVSKRSSLDPAMAKTETTAYADFSNPWVRGQVRSITRGGNDAPDCAQAAAIECRTFHATSALPVSFHSNGLLLQTFTHHTNGLLRQAIDPLGYPTTWDGHVRGQPTRVTHRDGTQQTADINAWGRPERHTNEANATTRYRYDAMDRLTLIDPQDEPGQTYRNTDVSYQRVNGSDPALTGSYWMQVIQLGNARTERHFDGLWRLRLERVMDTARPELTARVVESRYDAAGRLAFRSHPVRGITQLDQPGLTETRWRYDALGREISRTEDSELGPLVSATEHLTPFVRRLTNPRGYATTHHFQAYDEPAQAHIRRIDMPEQVSVSIERDSDGQPLLMSRSGSTGTVSRQFVYDVNRRLCKTIEPETGATVQHHGTSGMVDWRASGQPLPGTQSCDHGGVPPDRKISYGYDRRDRLTSTTFGDGSQNIARAHTPDGLLDWIETSGAGRSTIRWQYVYNQRRLLARETYTWGDPGPSSRWEFHRGINDNGHVSGVADPWGWMGYSPDALGQPTEISGYAGAVTHHPNGAVAGYTLNNGVSYTMTQNVRGLPAEWRHGMLVRDQYRYDANGNITQIDDLIHGRYRSMPRYDGLDRLREANGPWGSGRFEYDAQDNLTFSQVGARTLTHQYDPGSNRLTGIQGSLNMAIGYDANGNIANRAGQVYKFDIGNRLLLVPNKAGYAYDGHGRRNIVWYSDGTYAHQAYTVDGKLRLGWKLGEGGLRHVYLGDRLIAQTTESGQTTYVHTDALGSPVVRSTSSGAELNRTRYEPYGATEGGTHNPTGIGFTGHVNDPDTGLVYMQQRYYDPVAGRFLSVDPVTTGSMPFRVERDNLM